MPVHTADCPLVKKFSDPAVRFLTTYTLIHNRNLTQLEPLYLVTCSWRDTLGGQMAVSPYRASQV